MSPLDAAKCLDLPVDSTPDQLEARFHELRTKLEERIGRAPTPGLKAKYRESLDEITQAFETLTLAADSSSLPVLRRTTPALVPSAAPPPATIPPPADPAPGIAAPTALAVALMHLVGFVRFAFCAVIVFWIGLAAFAVLTDEATKQAHGESAALGIALGALPFGIFAWRASVRRHRQRAAEGKSNRKQYILAVVLVGLPLLAILTGFVLYFVERKDSALQTANALRESIPGYMSQADADLAKVEAVGREAAAELARLEASERTLAGRAAAPGSTELREVRALIPAYEKFIAWHTQTVAASPAKLLRAKLEIELKLLDKNPADATRVYREYCVKYSEAASSLRWTVTQNKPEPVYITQFDSWLEAAGRGDPASMWNLYLCYSRNRWAVEPDQAVARQWLEKAAAQGDSMACLELAELLLKEDGNPASLRAGVELLRKAAQNPRAARAMCTLADCLAAGKGVAQDEQAAIEWWQKAARLDNYSAREALKKRKLTW